MTHDEYEAKKARLQQAFADAQAEGRAAVLARDTARMAAAERACNAAWLALAALRFSEGESRP